MISNSESNIINNWNFSNSLSSEDLKLITINFTIPTIYKKIINILKREGLITNQSEYLRNLVMNDIQDNYLQFLLTKENKA